MSRVLQIGARTAAAGEVLDHLAQDAWASGAIALSGRLDPRYAAELSQRASHFGYRPDNGFFLHARDPEIQSVIYKGDAFLTRLEGAWWIWFNDWTDRNEPAA